MAQMLPDEREVIENRSLDLDDDEWLTSGEIAEMLAE